MTTITSKQLDEHVPTLQKRIKELEAEVLQQKNWAYKWKRQCEAYAELHKLAQAVVDSKRGMGHLVPSSVGWAIEELAAALEVVK